MLLTVVCILFISRLSTYLASQCYQSVHFVSLVLQILLQPIINILQKIVQISLLEQGEIGSMRKQTYICHMEDVLDHFIYSSSSSVVLT